MLFVIMLYFSVFRTALVTFTINNNCVHVADCSVNIVF